MKGFGKRLLYIGTIVPALALLVLYWLGTGRSGMKAFDRWEAWCFS